MKLIAIILSACVASTLAQDLGVPLSWRKFSNSRSLDERKSIARAGIDQLSRDYNSNKGEYNPIGFWPSAATVHSAMANYDYFTKSTVYKSRVTEALNKAFSLYAHYDEFGYNDDALWWATASYYAYRAYGDTNLLNHAIDTWNRVYAFQITSSQASSGTVSGKNFKIKGTCGASMVGGVFWRPVSDDTSVNSVTTGLFMTLSAYLAQVSGSATYRNAATAAGNWIKNANKNANGIVLDTIHANDCSRSPDSWLFTYNSGKYVEGLTALYAVTKDSALMTEATKVAAAGMKNAPWQGTDGVITEGSSPNENNDGVYFKSVWVRALNELFRATTSDQTSLAILIHSYIDVQYNAVLDLAGSNNIYSSSWKGPQQGYTGWGQAAAVDVLVSAITANT